MAQLSINLSAIKSNYRALQAKVGEECRVSAVVKANAYGLGAGTVAKALQEAGCNLFFVATMPEAIELRFVSGDACSIVMLNGYQDHNADLYIQNAVIPVLNDTQQVASYKARAKDEGKNLPAVLHFDTGMNRLGIPARDIAGANFDGIDVKCIMSHFASSEDAKTDLNDIQYKRFQSIAAAFPDIPKSLCNSSGIYQNDAYHYGIVRPGMALYGLNPTPELQNPMQPVVTLDAQILQIHDAQKGETAGYNATHRFENDTTLAIVDIGYADGIFRSLSNNANLYWHGIACPIRGRVSMDLTIIDLCNIPKDQYPKTGDMIEVIGSHQSADDLARNAGTIGYEILTSLSHRYARNYIKD